MFKACYTDSTMFSAIPLDEGWYGGTLQFLIPLLVIKWRNCFDENGGPLSDTSVTRLQICTLAYQQFVLLKSNSPQTLQAISNRCQQWPSNGHDQHGYVPKDHVALTKDVLVLLGKWKLSGSTVLNSRVKLGSPHMHNFWPMLSCGILPHDCYEAPQAVCTKYSWNHNSTAPCT